MSNAIVQVGPTEELKSGKHLLRAVLGGTLSNEEITLMDSWVKGMHDSVKQLSNDDKESVCILIDIRQMETYNDPTVITMIADLMKEDSPFVYKTATFGGTPLHEMIESVIRSMSGRSNLKNFKTEAEARAWLES